MILTIKSLLRIKTLNSEPNLDINLKPDDYQVIVNNGEVVLMSTKDNYLTSDRKWKYVGDENYYSTGSDFPFVCIKDRDEKIPALDNEWIEDNVQNFLEHLNSFIFEIPSGNAGGLSVYQTLNDKNEITGLIINGVCAEDF